jgi:hypothetical protein
MGDAFDIDVEKGDRRKLDALQNSFAKFEYGQASTFDPHLVFN